MSKTRFRVNRRIQRHQVHPLAIVVEDWDPKLTECNYPDCWQLPHQSGKYGNYCYRHRHVYTSAITRSIKKSSTKLDY